MNIKINSTSFEVTESIRDYIVKKIGTLDKFVPVDSVCEIELAKITERQNKGDIFKAEINIDFPQKNIFAVSEKPSLYEAIDDLKEELEKIIISRKEKKETLFKKGAKKIKNIIRGFGLYE